MDTFHKHLITTKSTKRKIMILEILSNEPLGLSTIELLAKLNTSEKTLSLDIDELNGLTENKYLKVTKGIYSLLKNSEKLILEIEYTLLAKEPLFRILMSYYNNETRSLSEWSTRLYIADRTLERYLSKLKLLANEYELKLKYNPISFTGSEINIRLFLHTFLSSYTFLDDQMIVSEQEVYLKIIDYIQNDTTLHPTVKMNSILVWIKIIKKRIAGGCYIDFKKKISSDTFNDENKVYYHQIWDLLDIPCPDYVQDTEFTFMALIHNHLGYYKNEILFTYLNEVNDDVEMFFLEIVKTFNIHYSVRLKMYQSYKAYIFNVHQLTLLSPLFQKNSPELNEYTKKKYSRYFNQVKQAFAKYTIKFADNHLIYIDDIIVNITLIISSYTNYPQLIFKKIGIFIDGNMNFVLLIQEKLNLLKPENIEFHFFSYEEISATNLALIGIDNFITNNELIYSVLYYSDVEVIKISTYPTELDWINILSFLFKTLQ